MGRWAHERRDDGGDGTYGFEAQSSEEEKPLLSIVARIVSPETEPGKRVCTL